MRACRKGCDGRKFMMMLYSVRCTVRRSVRRLDLSRLNLLISVSCKKERRPFIIIFCLASPNPAGHVVQKRKTPFPLFYLSCFQILLVHIYVF
jgi:hypothetical protein